MGLESGTYISDFVATNPTTTDKRRQGDDHLRWIKAAILATFPNLDGAMNASDTELNYVVGVTSLIQDQLDAKYEAVGDGLQEDDATTVSVSPGVGIDTTSGDVDLDIAGLTALAIDGITPDEDSFAVDDNGTPKKMLYNAGGIKVQTEDSGTSRTIVAADLNTWIPMNNADPIAVDLDTGVGAKGNVLVFEQVGAGQITIGGTATVRSPHGLKTRTQYSKITLTCVGTDTWSLGGDSTS